MIANMDNIDTSRNNINILILPSAKEKIEELVLDESGNGYHLRVFVQGGGCSGLTYGFSFDKNISEDDTVIEISNEIKLLVDCMSFPYINGAEIDYKEDLMNSQFVINNPNANSTCGCGSSFSVE